MLDRNCCPILNIFIFVLLIFNSIDTSRGSDQRQKRDYIIQSKSICIKDLNYQFQRVQCQYPRAQFDIVNAGLYNSTSYVNGTLLAWCLPITKYTPLVSTVTNALMAQCSQYSCLIVMKTIDSLIGDPSINKDDLVLDINYSCRNAGFTYFFYIITLILSTSCILVGGAFILRKFLLLRRRNNFIARRTRANQGYVPNSSSENQINSNGADGIWTTAYPPPAYDNIYESSLPVNPLPDYDSTLNNQTKEEKKDGDRGESPAPYNLVVFANREEVVSIVNPAFSHDVDTMNPSISGREENAAITEGVSVEDLRVGAGSASKIKSKVKGQRRVEEMVSERDTSLKF